MIEEAIEAGLHWIDLGLTEVNNDAQDMTTAIENATPRSAGEAKPRVWVHPDDVREICSWIETRTESEEARAVLGDAYAELQS